MDILSLLLLAPPYTIGTDVAHSKGCVQVESAAVYSIESNSQSYYNLEVESQAYYNLVVSQEECS